ncbi:MAG: D-alanyl-D-alanine carboxypeptidase family protein [Lachnospiraceae bacterium]
MERGIQIKSYVKRFSGIILSIGMLLSLTGCNSLQPSYFDAWSSNNQELAAADMEIWRAEGVASSLCIVEDEAAYNDALFQSEAAGIFNITTGETIYCKNAFKMLAPASMTKLMTLYVAIKYGNLNEIVTIPEEAQIEQLGVQVCRFETGSKMKLKDLLCAMMLHSGNDAAKAVALHFSDTADDTPTVKYFVSLMNQEAKNMGATSTKFVNPHGLDASGQVSTVYDMYLILYHCIQNETIREILGMETYSFTYTKADGTERTRIWNNTNLYMNNSWRAPSGFVIWGGKTGSSDSAGYCLVLYSEDSRQNEYISVIMNAPTNEVRYEEMNQLLQMSQDNITSID